MVPKKPGKIKIAIKTSRQEIHLKKNCGYDCWHKGLTEVKELNVNKFLKVVSPKVPPAWFETKIQNKP